MEQFRTDNTEGYTDEQLKELNRRANEIINDEMDEQDVKNISEKILRKFDSEIYNR